MLYNIKNWRVYSLKYSKQNDSNNSKEINWEVLLQAIYATVVNSEVPIKACDIQSELKSSYKIKIPTCKIIKIMNGSLSLSYK